VTLQNGLGTTHNLGASFSCRPETTHGRLFVRLRLTVLEPCRTHHLVMAFVMLPENFSAGPNPRTHDIAGMFLSRRKVMQVAANFSQASLWKNGPGYSFQTDGFAGVAGFRSFFEFVALLPRPRLDAHH